MDTPRPAAERVRHILQAMERSIDTARRQRLHTSGSPAQPVAIAPATQTVFPRPASTLAQPSAPNADNQRLKARPKRAETFASPYDQPVYRSQTG
jgi:hypothetical protein